MKSRIIFCAFIMGACLSGCDKLNELQDPSFKYVEPYLGKWNLTSVKAYDLFVPGGNADNAQTTNEREYNDVAGWIEFKKDKDSDDSYYRGSFSVTYGTVDYLGGEYPAETYEGAFKWDADEDKSIYVEMDDSKGKVLGAALSIATLNPKELTSSTMKLTFTDGGFNDEYNVVEFTFTK
ncbi:hypothetical protein RT717_09575 [Imperialibacter roseus]|uniref:Lipocalin-like domain-containing protein n=1 Tax=Imperialibacter roseus TaxID=1324217 RepID=A0ABZ0IV73_9BACT|nr:hypothetical protein [Imperialibacter roseus]WOK08884.1 hypothetical protein RT717_09575 [Imperialibacter roseus]